jgi:hypothetical protein
MAAKSYLATGKDPVKKVQYILIIHTAWWNYIATNPKTNDIYFSSKEAVKKFRTQKQSEYDTMHRVAKFTIAKVEPI